jgi:hypothetical protein
MKSSQKTLFLLLSTIIFLTSCENNKEKTLIIQSDSTDGIDAFIEDYPSYIDRNFGDYYEFQASAFSANSNDLVVRCLIKFDLSSIPSNSEVTSAELYLFSVDNTVNGPGHVFSEDKPNDFLLQKITSDWDEHTVTWNNQPTTSIENQVYSLGSDSINQNYIINISNLVQDMINYPENNFGLMMRLVTETKYRKILFASSDYEELTKHPKLIVNYK